MATKYFVDRSNQTFGVMQVLNRSEKNKRKYEVIWLCCNTKDLVTTERVGWQVRLPDLKCFHCQKLEEKLKAKAEKGENKEPDPAGITIPGMGFYPFLTLPMGRFATAGGNTNPRRPDFNPE